MRKRVCERERLIEQLICACAMFMSNMRENMRMNGCIGESGANEFKLIFMFYRLGNLFFHNISRKYTKYLYSVDFSGQPSPPYRVRACAHVPDIPCFRARRHVSMSMAPSQSQTLAIDRLYIYPVHTLVALLPLVIIISELFAAAK